MSNIFHYARQSSFRQVIERLLVLRALLFVGVKYTCPCCGWRLRAFTRGGASFKLRQQGYCPRCNSKARHRRNWLYLQQKTNLFADNLSVFHISPKYSLSRQLKTRSNLDYIAVDINNRPHIGAKMDITASAMPSNSMDAIICIHVLEHVQQDRKAIGELYRLLKPGGWAIISVPIRLDQKTYEDSSIITPQERERAFGETGHFRFYGYDLLARLESYGFQVELDLGENINPQTREKYGLLDDENIFYCTKA